MPCAKERRKRGWHQLSGILQSDSSEVCQIESLWIRCCVQKIGVVCKLIRYRVQKIRCGVQKLGVVCKEAISGKSAHIQYQVSLYLCTLNSLFPC